jgi:hypothetical protein
MPWTSFGSRHAEMQRDIDKQNDRPATMSSARKSLNDKRQPTTTEFKDRILSAGDAFQKCAQLEPIQAAETSDGLLVRPVVLAN